MKKIFVLSFGLVVAGCNQTTQQASLDSPATPAPPPKQENMQDLPPIYDPLVDMHKKSPAKFAKDHADCRLQAEPQERAARAAMTQQQTAAALQVAGSLVSMLPAKSYRQANNLSNTGSFLQDVGASAGEAAAAQGAGAAGDYALVINTCLRHRGYTLLK